MDKKYSAQEVAQAVLKKAEEMLKSSKLAKSKVHSDLDHGSKLGPQGYSKYQEQAQNQKGVHTPVSGVTGFPGGKGTSEAGDMSTQTYGGKPHEGLREHGKDLHRAKLSEMKEMPKPNLPKSEEASTDATLMKEADATPADGVQKEDIGQHNPAEGKENGNPPWGTEPGTYKLAKFMGHRAEKRKAKQAPINKSDTLAENPAPARMKRAADYKERGDTVSHGIAVDGAKESHKEKLADIKAQPKPKLTKGEGEE